MFHGGLSHDHSKWASFGSFFGGVAGTIFSFGTFILLIFSYFKTEEDKNIEKKESIFFKMLDLQSENRSQLTFDSKSGLEVLNSILEKISFIRKKCSFDYDSIKNKSPYIKYRKIHSDFLYIQAHIQTFLEFDIVILNYIYKEMPASNNDYLTAFFSQVGQIELSLLIIIFSTRIEANDHLKKILIQRCYTAKDYEAFIETGKILENFKKFFNE